MIVMKINRFFINVDEYKRNKRYISSNKKQKLFLKNGIPYRPCDIDKYYNNKKLPGYTIITREEYINLVRN